MEKHDGIKIWSFFSIKVWWSRRNRVGKQIKSTKRDTNMRAKSTEYSTINISSLKGDQIKHTNILIGNSTCY